MIVALLALAAAHSGYGTTLDDDWPPRRFRSNRGVYVIFAPAQRIQEFCNDGAPDPDGYTTAACEDDETGALWLPNPCRFRHDPYAKTLCHELGHANGWPGNHPKK